MGIFDMLGGNPATPATPAAPADTATPAAPAAPDATATPAAPATPASPAAPAAPTAPAASDANDPFNINAMLAHQRGAAETPSGPTPDETFARSLISSVLSGEGRPDGPAAAPQVRPEIFAQAMESADFTSGIDLGALETALTSGEGIQDALKGALQAAASNAVFAMVPLVNQMATAVQGSTLQEALQQGSQATRSEQIVTHFNQSYPYSSNPVVSEMVGTFAESLAAKAPPSATPQDLSRALHQMLSSMSGSIVGDTKTEAPVAGLTKDFSDLFSPAPT